MRIPDPEAALDAFPHQFSGGMRQRIAIAEALACEPKLILADEPTTALDVTVQAGILRLLDALRRGTGLSLILITHDLGVMSSLADHMSIFYAGRVVERVRAPRCCATPSHPYTRALLRALPHPGVAKAGRAPADRRRAAGRGPGAVGLRLPPALRLRCRDLRDARATARAPRQPHVRVSCRPVRQVP